VDGSVLDVGRKTRTIPPAIRRALLARDSGCQFPGCTARRCDGHHIRHWADGGPTTLHNLALLCRRHHRAVHEEGFAVIRGDDGALTFYRPDGTRVVAAPAMPQCGNDDADAHWQVTKRLDAASCWDGTPLDIGWALDVLRSGSRH
jgi:hypothetical protein